MASTNEKLEQQLMEAGNRLFQVPSSVDELLPLLDQVENFLSRVEQSPPKSMQEAFYPSVNALYKDELLRHSDVDVKVAVASCISEITRITAPDAPYDDDKMKDVFQLIVSSFENLSDKSSRSYNKRVTILETVAKVRSCVVMLDLECDGLIVEMFQHFLKAIRDDHPETVSSSMETIMTLVLEESEDISLELLTPILASVKRDNEEVLPVARKLGEKVLENCAVKLKRYLTHAVNSLGIPLDDYSKVVATICGGTTGAVEHNDDNSLGEQLVDEGKLTKASSDEAAQADDRLTTASSDETAQLAKESATEDACPEEVDPAVDRSPKSVMSNKTGIEETSMNPETLKKSENDHLGNESVDVNLTSKVDTDDSDVKSESKSEVPEQTNERRGRNPNSLINSGEPSDSSRVDSEKEAEKLPDYQKSRSKDVHSSPGKDPIDEAPVPSESEKATDIELFPPKALESEIVNVASPSPSESLPDENRQKKAGRPRKKESLFQENPPSGDVSMKVSEGTSDSEVKPQTRTGKKARAEVVSVKASEGTSDSEVKPQKRSAKKIAAGATKEDKIVTVKGTDKTEGGTTSDSEAKSLRQHGKKGDASASGAKLLKQSGKKVDASNEDISSLKKEDGKRRGRGKDTTKKDSTSPLVKNDSKETISSPKSTTESVKDEGHIEETPKINTKRKHTPGKVKVSETVVYGENLVRSKIKVWWPDDHEFYEGVIDSFDPVKKKHKVLYTDGDEEILNLQKERWEFVKDDNVSDGELAAEDPSPDVSSEKHKKKKAKTDSEASAKQEKMDISPKRIGAASSGKSKGTAPRSGRKSKDDGKVDIKSKDITSKHSGNDTGGKTKAEYKRSGGKSVDSASRAASKSKDVDSATPKSTSKSNQDTPKTITKSKGKMPKTGNKSDANGKGRMKFSLLKVKETENAKGKSPDSGKASESVKLKKSPDTSKLRESEPKSGKKRRRGVKG